MLQTVMEQLPSTCAASSAFDTPEGATLQHGKRRKATAGSATTQAGEAQSASDLTQRQHSGPHSAGSHPSLGACVQACSYSHSSAALIKATASRQHKPGKPSGAGGMAAPSELRPAGPPKLSHALRRLLAALATQLRPQHPPRGTSGASTGAGGVQAQAQMQQHMDGGRHSGALLLSSAAAALLAALGQLLRQDPGALRPAQPSVEEGAADPELASMSALLVLVRDLLLPAVCQRELPLEGVLQAVAFLSDLGTALPGVCASHEARAVATRYVCTGAVGGAASASLPIHWRHASLDGRGPDHVCHEPSVDTQSYLQSSDPHHLYPLTHLGHSSRPCSPAVLCHTLVELHLRLLSGLSPSQCSPAPVRSGLWTALLADLHRHSPQHAIRTALLRSFSVLVSGLGRGTLSQLLHQLTASTPNSSSSLSSPAAAAAAATAAAAAQCLLLTLESARGPRALATMGATSAHIVSYCLSTGNLVRTAAAGPQDADPATGLTMHMHATLEAAQCCLLRCCESVCGRAVTFVLSPLQVSCMLHGVVLLWQGYAHESAVGGDGHTLGRGRLHCSTALFTSSCSLLVSLLRHHPDSLKRCMAPLLAACRHLLLAICHWGTDPASWQTPTFSSMTHNSSNGAQPDEAGHVSGHQAQATPVGGMVDSCQGHVAGLGPAEEGGGRAGPSSSAAAMSALCRGAADLGRVYEAVAEHRASTSKYCIHLLADYLAIAVVPLASVTPGMTAGLDASGVDMDELSARPALPSAPRAALQLGAFHLIACLSPGELQHLHAALGEGGGQRTAIGSVAAEEGLRAGLQSGKV
ncbi:MAG: hypothetical protein WDW38_000110 [Sanguina aurantia]